MITPGHEPTILHMEDHYLNYGMAFPGAVEQVAEAYQAGAELRAEDEGRIWWSNNPLQSARAWKDSGNLLVRYVSKDDPTTCQFANPEKPWQVTATAVVAQDLTPDIMLWQDFADPNQGIYIHRLATHPNFRGLRQGEALLAAIAAGHAYQRDQRPYIRLDCDVNATRLRDYYERRIGMVCLGEATRPSGYHAALYQAHGDDMVPYAWRPKAVASRIK